MEFLTQTCPSRGTSLQPLPAVDAGSFGVVLIAGKHVCCSECMSANQPGPMLMKLTIICEVHHVIIYTRSSSPLFFSGMGA